MYSNYQEAWINFPGQPARPGLADVHRFMATLDRAALAVLIEDILADRIEALQPVFGRLSGRDSPVDEVAFDALMDAPPELIQTRLSPLFDDLFVKALARKLDSQQLALKVIDRLKAITAKNKTGLSATTILNAIEQHRSMSDSLRLELLMLLPTLESPDADYSFWMELLEQLPAQPYLGAAVIEAFKRKRPWEALLVLECYNDPKLAKYKPRDDHYTYFDTALDTALYYFLREPSESNVAEYHRLYTNLQTDWTRSMLDQILRRPPFRFILNYMRQLVPDEPRPITAHQAYEAVLACEGDTVTCEALANQLRAAPTEHLELINLVIVRYFRPDHLPEILCYFHPFFCNWSDDFQELVRKRLQVQMSYGDAVLEDLKDLYMNRDHLFRPIDEIYKTPEASRKGTALAFEQAMGTLLKAISAN